MTLTCFCLLLLLPPLQGASEHARELGGKGSDCHKVGKEGGGMLLVQRCPLHNPTWLHGQRVVQGGAEPLNSTPAPCPFFSWRLNPQPCFPTPAPPVQAAVIGDTVGDPLKDTSGPSLNILIKLMAVESLVLAPFFLAHT